MLTSPPNPPGLEANDWHAQELLLMHEVMRLVGRSIRSRQRHLKSLLMGSQPLGSILLVRQEFPGQHDIDAVALGVGLAHDVH